MDPINYNVDVQSPFQAAIQGYQAGAAIRNDQVVQQQQQLALQQQQQQAKVIQQLISKPDASADDYANATMLVPGMKDQFKQAWDTKNAQQQQNDLNHISQVFGALQGGQPNVAATLLDQRAQALRNAGNEADAKNAETMAGIVRAHPDFAKSLIGMKLSAIPGGDKVITSASTLAKTPGEVRKINADAATAEVAAGNAPAKTDLENQKAQQDIQTAEAQRRIAELNTQIAQANSETDRGKLILERDKWNTELAKLQQAQGQGAQDSIDSTTQALGTLKQIKEHPAFKAQEYGGVWSKIKGTIPGTDRQAMDGWIDSLKGQLGYNNLLAMKASSPTGASGLGALSEGEMKMLSNLAGNLDPNSADFPKQLDSVEKFLNKAQAKSIARGQAPTSGTTTPVIMTHPTFGQVRDADVNRLMQKYPNQTRDQILQFLRETGGK